VCLVTTLLIFSTECVSEKILKIGRYLTKIWTEVCGLLFYGPPCILKFYAGGTCHVISRMRNDDSALCLYENMMFGAEYLGNC